MKTLTTETVHHISAVLLLLVLFCSCRSETPDPPQEPLSEMEQYGVELGEKIKLADMSIIFIGNSHTAYNRIAKQVERLLKGEWPDKKIFCQERAVLGKGLNYHADDEQTNVEVTAGPWDFVVLQGHRFDANGADKHSTYFSDLAKKQNSKVFLYSVWGRKNQRPRSNEIYSMMSKLAEADQNLVTPVGLAWDRVRKERPDIELFLPDNNHASPHGGYLTALVIANSVTGKHIETRLTNKTFEDVSPETADYFAEIASEVVAEHISAVGKPQ